MARQIETPFCKYGETTALWGLTFLRSPVDFDIPWQAFTGMPSTCILIFCLPLVLADDTVLLNVDALGACCIHAIKQAIWNVHVRMFQGRKEALVISRLNITKEFIYTDLHAVQQIFHVPQT